jgi:la-related protein 1
MWIREYYFSLDNLCKDLFLRKHMDSQGFVLLSVLTQFNRIRQLTQDLDLIRFVCMRSPTIEYYCGPDGIDRVRKAEGWDQWVLNMEERDPEAKSDGPLLVHYPPFLPMPQQTEATRGRQGVSTPSSAPLPAQYPYFQPSLGENTNETNAAATPRTADNAVADAQINQAPLSATVPDFTPIQQPPPSDFAPSEPSHSTPDTFSDEQVEGLSIIIRKPANPTSPSRASFTSTAALPLSNGSVDSRVISDDLVNLGDRHSILNANGDRTPERYQSTGCAPGEVTDV